MFIDLNLAFSIFETSVPNLNIHSEYLKWKKAHARVHAKMKTWFGYMRFKPIKALHMFPMDVKSQDSNGLTVVEAQECRLKF